MKTLWNGEMVPVSGDGVLASLETAALDGIAVDENGTVSTADVKDAAIMGAITPQAVSA